MKIILTGGTGYLGRLLSQYFVENKHEVIVFTRKNKQDKKGITYVNWSSSMGYWKQSLLGADVIINLAGKSVNCRYNERNKQAIYESRLSSTYKLGAAIQDLTDKPKLWINASSATIYKESFDVDHTETGTLGGSFSEDVCKKWEDLFYSFSFPTVRMVSIRTSIVFGSHGEVFEKFSLLKKLGVGKAQGNGNQFMSWISEADFCRAMDFIIQKSSITGPVNVTAPNPIQNKEFMKRFTVPYQWPIQLGLNKYLLEIGAFLLGTETELLLKSRKVVPTKLLSSGFQFIDRSFSLDNRKQR